MSAKRAAGDKVVYGSGIVVNHGTRRYLTGFDGEIANSAFELVAATGPAADDGDVGCIDDVENELTDELTGGQEIVDATTVAEVNQVLNSEELVARVVAGLELY